MFKAGEFAIYDGNAVAIEQIRVDPRGDMFLESIADIRLIQRNRQDRKAVPVDQLRPFNTENANKLIGEYNMRIHAIKECLLYNEE